MSVKDIQDYIKGKHTKQEERDRRGIPEDGVIPRFRVKKGRLISDPRGNIILLSDAADLEDAAINMKMSYYSDIATVSEALGEVFGEDVCHKRFEELGLGPMEAAAQVIAIYGVITGAITDPEEVKEIMEEAEQYGIPTGGAHHGVQ
jgi:hypothetical protein